MQPIKNEVRNTWRFNWDLQSQNKMRELQKLTPGPVIQCLGEEGLLYAASVLGTLT